MNSGLKAAVTPLTFSVHAKTKIVNTTWMENITLDQVKKGTPITIVSLPKGAVKVQLLRMGITEGDTIQCLERLPGGTVVIQKNRQEIALGFDLAKTIHVITH